MIKIRFAVICIGYRNSQIAAQSKLKSICIEVVSLSVSTASRFGSQAVRELLARLAFVVKSTHVPSREALASFVLCRDISWKNHH